MLTCDNDRRRDLVRAKSGVHGLDFLEVDAAQVALIVYFLGKAPARIDASQLRVEGGRSERDRVRVRSVELQRSSDAFVDDRMVVQLDKLGDFSTYRLRVCGVEGFDSRYEQLDFSFKIDCPKNTDCLDENVCPAPVPVRPEIDRLAKDYASFRRLMLDRMSLLVPEWRERNIPDLGVTLVELLAYTGDYLSYYQDAVATEAYIATARRRPSVRRHARLVDYALNEGCNARTLVLLEVTQHVELKPAELYFITGGHATQEIGSRHAVVETHITGLAQDSYEVFEPMLSKDACCWPQHNRICFYTWGDRECCLTRGSTRATLRGRLGTGHGELRLQRNDFLVFEEVVGPKTGSESDADPKHRHAVRLTSVTASCDELTGQHVVEITWSVEDRLPFDLCLSSTTQGPNCKYIADVSVARGNAVLVDHGRTVPPVSLGCVGTKHIQAICECEGHAADVVVTPARFRPRIERTPLTWAMPLPPSYESATRTLTQDPRRAEPAIQLQSVAPKRDGSGPSVAWDACTSSTPQLRVWRPLRDLLSSGPRERAFVVEMEEDGSAQLLFAQNGSAARPEAGEAFRAMYRIGRGPAGNVGAGAISLLVHRASDLSQLVTRVRNPLAAQGGVAPETMAEAKLNAPHAFRSGPSALQRAITADDYAQLAERDPRLQKAVANLRWTGSWMEADVAFDPLAFSESADPVQPSQIEQQLEPFRRLGHDLRAQPAVRVPILLRLSVCIAPGYLQAHVRRALSDAFSTRALPNGKLGFFHPDRLTFGGHLYLSVIVAEAQQIPGVVSVRVDALQRQFAASDHEIEQGILRLAPFEIAQLENSPNYPDRGQIEIQIGGGR